MIVAADTAGTWTLVDLTVDRIGSGAMRLPRHGQAFAPGAVPRGAGKVSRCPFRVNMSRFDRTTWCFRAK